MSRGGRGIMGFRITSPSLVALGPRIWRWRVGVERLAAEIGVIGSTGPGWPSLPDAIARHDAAISEVHARGAFGVPSFLVGDELFFGNDQPVLLEDRLTGRSA